MKAREFDPRRLDVRALAKAGAELAGDWPLAGFERLRASLVAHGDAAPAGAVHWTARGELVPVRGGVAQVWLHVQATADLPLQCQRCLEPVVESVTLARDFQFVADEAAAAELDAEVEHEVLVLAREFDLHELLEDELLLDLPLVPRHEVCPQPLPATAQADAEFAPPPSENPFAALAALRKGQT